MAARPEPCTSGWVLLANRSDQLAMYRAGRVTPARAGGLDKRGPGAFKHPQSPIVGAGTNADGTSRATV